MCLCVCVYRSCVDNTNAYILVVSITDFIIISAVVAVVVVEFGFVPNAIHKTHQNGERKNLNAGKLFFYD